jgi:hypothetical protein
MSQGNSGSFQSFLSLAFLLAVVVIGGGLLYKNLSSGFPSDELNKYQTMWEDSQEQKGRKPHRKGKVLLLVEAEPDSWDKGLQVHPEQESLPADLRAEPGDVGTLAIVSTSEKEVGRYGYSARALRVDTRVRLLDAKTGKWMGAVYKKGGSPPKEKRYREGSYDEHTDVRGKPASLTKIIKSLPKK